jgi:poly(A) polymerase
MSAPASLKGAAWLEAPATRAVIEALDRERADGPAIRFVGGCVRNTLLGLSADDVDIATIHTPETVMRLASDAGLKPVPTGLDHGTVTVVAHGKPFEVTTLRIDVKAHGRHADVAYTEDWQEDARRRDFTMNAIYADPDGTLFDPVGGVADAARRHVRFIGDAHERIREDYLRILRFFRIHAWYGKGDPDADGLAACIEEKEGLKRLSAERIQKELLRLLEAREPLASLRAMAEAGILSLVLPEASAMERLAALVIVEADHLRRADGVRRLSALAEVDEEGARAIANRLRLSNAQSVRLARLAALWAEPPLSPEVDGKTFRTLLYRDGIACVTDRIILAWTARGAEHNIDRWKELIAFAEVYDRPRLPITGRDVMALGLSGARVGDLMDAVEAWWIEADFAPERGAALAKLRALAKPD